MLLVSKALKPGMLLMGPRDPIMHRIAPSPKQMIIQPQLSVVSSSINPTPSLLIIFDWKGQAFCVKERVFLMLSIGVTKG